ncbi:hypothetical protein Tco_1143088 [Tanacetum coccineum]
MYFREVMWYENACEREGLDNCSLPSVCHAALVVWHDALRALVDMLLVGMLIKGVSLVAMLLYCMMPQGACSVLNLVGACLSTYTLYHVITCHVYPSSFDSKNISQTDGAQSSRMPTSLPNNLHLTVGQAHTPATIDTESEPEEAPIKI